MTRLREPALPGDDAVVGGEDADRVAELEGKLKEAEKRARVAEALAEFHRQELQESLSLVEGAGRRPVMVPGPDLDSGLLDRMGIDPSEITH